ncbi:MAG: Ig-like domain-containing protein, partial [Thermoplasmata archaeon]|nr:Ig-like domain-containing protein [Thermoplasmata archaeon]
ISPNVKGTFHWVGTTLTFIHADPLDYETQYNVTISTIAQDLVGNNIELPLSWQFTTESLKDTSKPTVLDKSPKGFNIPVDTKISVAFSELMQEKATEDAFAISPTINGTFDWLGATLTFTPSSPLDYETEYEVTISTQAKNLVGNSLEQGLQWSFTTEPIPEGDVPPSRSEKQNSVWDYWEPIITILTIVGTVVATLIGFFRLRRKESKLRRYLDKIDDTFNSYKMNAQTCEKELIDLKETIKAEYKAGKIIDNHYLILDRKIDDHLKEMRIISMKDSEILHDYSTRNKNIKKKTDKAQIKQQRPKQEKPVEKENEAETKADEEKGKS